MLKVKSFGLACGIMWLVVVAWTIVLALIGRGLLPFNIINQFYLGWLSLQVGGIVFSLALAFVDGFIAGAVFAWLYNKFAK